MNTDLYKSEKYAKESMVPYLKHGQTLNQDDYDDILLQFLSLLAYDIYPTGRNKAIWMRDARYIANTYIQKMIKDWK